MIKLADSPGAELHRSRKTAGNTEFLQPWTHNRHATVQPPDTF